tara:strand:- start:865 stop:1566 length:702 start_codon:yes stop_codon:yes gene_type:complete
MKIYISLVCLFFAQKIIAFRCKNGETIVSRFSKDKIISDMEIDQGYESRPELISHLEAEIDDIKFIISPNMTLYMIRNKTKSKLARFSGEFLTESKSAFVFKSHDRYFFEIGFDSYFEGYQAKVYIINLKSKKIVDELHKCANNEEFFGLKKGELVYSCLYKCKRNIRFVYKKDKDKFVQEYKKHDCNKLNYGNKLTKLKKVDFNLKLKKDKNGNEYKTTRFPLNRENCKPIK